MRRLQNPTRGGGVWEPRFLTGIDPSRCTGCGFCLKVCPAGVFHGPCSPDSVPEVHLERCWGCTICERMCKDGAITCDTVVCAV
ncbi:MAG TPA: ferredoxin family protein [Candidatus Ozemobacteraceae bacterium]|nr:ferredoxin family protein [Candidatus Ozemobacteraceae bacterium]